MEDDELEEGEIVPDLVEQEAGELPLPPPGLALSPARELQMTAFTEGRHTSKASSKSQERAICGNRRDRQPEAVPPRRGRGSGQRVASHERDRERRLGGSLAETSGRGQVEDESKQLEKEVAELASTVSMHSLLRSAETALANLRTALKKLYSLYRLLKQKEGVAGADGSPRLAQLGAKVLGGLKAMHVMSSTGAGRAKLQGLTVASAVLQNVMQDRAVLLAQPQRRELEGLVGSSKVFQALLHGTSKQLPSQVKITAQTAAPSTPDTLHDASAQLNKGQKQLLNKKQRDDAIAAAAKAVQTFWQHAEPKPPANNGNDAVAPAAKAVQTFWQLAEPKPPASKGAAPSNKRPRVAAPSQVTNQGPSPAPPLPGKLMGDFVSFESDDEAVLSWNETSLQWPSHDTAPLPPGLTPLQPPAAEKEEDTKQDRTAAVAADAVPQPGTGAVNSSTVKLSEAAMLAAVERLAQARREEAVRIAQRLKDTAADALLRQNKLCLVLDLDHTLLNSARYAELDQDTATLLHHHYGEEQALRAPENRELHQMESIQMWTKLRPACRQFLEHLAERFVMWIHTNGNKAYAAAMARLLDPEGRFFSSRIIANTATANGNGILPDALKSLRSNGLEGLDAVTVIVDDSSAVWPGYAPNLITVERYVYFPSSRRQLGLGRPSLLEGSRDECPDTGMLVVIEAVLVELHRRIIAALRAASPDGGESAGLGGNLPPWDVRIALGLQRLQVLAGTRLLFSRLWPSQAPVAKQPLWRLALELGASCTTETDAAVTHIVTNTQYTAKAHWARQYGKHVVRAEWLEASAVLWRRPEEAAFAVADEGIVQPSQVLPAPPEPPPLPPF